MPKILHVTPRSDWETAVLEGQYRGDSLETEGFLHCCTREQLPGVLDRFFRGKTGLVVLTIATERLRSPLLWASSPDDIDDFPHIHGPLNVDAVIDVEKIKED